MSFVASSGVMAARSFPCKNIRRRFLLQCNQQKQKKKKIMQGFIALELVLHFKVVCFFSLLFLLLPPQNILVYKLLPCLANISTTISMQFKFNLDFWTSRTLIKLRTNTKLLLIAEHAQHEELPGFTFQGDVWGLIRELGNVQLFFN